MLHSIDEDGRITVGQPTAFVVEIKGGIAIGHRPVSRVPILGAKRRVEGMKRNGGQTESVVYRSTRRDAL